MGLGSGLLYLYNTYTAHIYMYVYRKASLNQPTNQTDFKWSISGGCQYKEFQYACSSIVWDVNNDRDRCRCEGGQSKRFYVSTAYIYIYI